MQKNIKGFVLLIPMSSKEKNIIDSVIYNYTATSSALEEENQLLKDTISKMKEELDRLKTPPLMICEVMDIHDDNAVIRIPNGNQFYVTYNAEANLKAGDSVLCDQKNLNIVKKIDTSRKFNVEKFVIVEKPDIKWESVGGLKEQENEIREVIELPLKKPELFRKVGITPPKGILLHGPPGTGKTLLAKAVAASTNSTFIEVVGSELVQKFIGEGAKLVKEIFDMARKKAPAIIFIDEIDSLAACRMEVGTSGEREANRTFMQLLAEIDGFKSLDDVKIIGATNRKDILDPAVIRPGRLDRIISVPNPNNEGRKEIFKIHSSKMNIDDDVDIDIVVEKMDGFSGAEIKSVCTEAGYFAIRDNRSNVKRSDILKAVIKVRKEEELDEEHLNMFG
ncbi:proteasome-activating nucleotidase [Candidatus Woesearchaeota archaeon]|nr:proteasome-activating nucleotidase [Candidatus Woesearchaeota archaeon]